MPVTICTGFNELLDEKKGKKLGVRGALMKPVTKKDLEIVIRKVMDVYYLSMRPINRLKKRRGAIERLRKKF